MARPRRHRRTRARLAVVRFYFDADVLGLAHVIAGLREDATYPGDPGATIHKRARPPCPITPGTIDSIWIPKVARDSWAIITRDKRIERRPNELQTVLENGGRMFAITSPEQLRKWDQLEILMRCWRALEAKAAEPGPYVIPLRYSGLGKDLLAGA
jgi:PIN like domain